MKRPVKMLSLFLVLVISLFSLSVAAFAEDNSNITANMQGNRELSNKSHIGSGRLVDFPGIVIDPIYRSDIGISPFAFKTKTQNAYMDGTYVGTVTLEYETVVQGGRPQFVYDSTYLGWDLSLPNYYVLSDPTIKYTGDLITVTFVASMGSVIRNNIVVKFTP